MTVLVTGGYGFIGQHLVRRLLDFGEDVVVVDSDIAEAYPPSTYDVKEVTALTVPVETPGLMETLVRQFDFDAVYHLASIVGVERYISNPHETVWSIIASSNALFDTMLQLNECPPILYTSTSEVYGKGTGGVMSEGDDIVFGRTDIPRWSYGMAKAIEETLALADERLNIRIVRLFNTVGPFQTGRYGMVLPRFVSQALKNDPITVYGDGTQSRCFCDVEDVVSALTAAVDTHRTRHRVMNIGSDRLITMNDLAEMVRTVLHSSSAIIHRSYDHAYGPGFEDVQHRTPDLSAAGELIKWDSSNCTRLETTILRVAEAMSEGRGAVTAFDESGWPVGSASKERTTP